MKLFILAVVLLATTAIAEKCPKPVNVEAKQKMVDTLISYINKPANPVPPKPPIDPKKLIGIGILPKDQVFSLFDERTWDEVSEVLKRFMAAPTFEDFIKVAETLYPHVNEDLFLFGLSVAIVHRPDANGVHVPRVHEVYPDKFLTNDVLINIRKQIIKGHKNPVVKDTHYYHNDFDPFRRVDYFTEDLGMNSHHYHWHVLHPSIWTQDIGEKSKLGELFYWMHRQMVARFDSELLSVHLPRISSLDDWNKKVKIGYAPHLTIQRTGYTYMNRPENLEIEDLPELTKGELMQWKNRIMEAIARHNITLKGGPGKKLRTTPENGIDIFGHLIAATKNSTNRRYYGNLHSYAHVIAARIADSDGEHMEDNGAMYDVATSARDPLFYSWHKFIDKLFTEYQMTLTPYTPYQLTWPDVVVDGIHIENLKTHEENMIHTYYTSSTLRLSKGFDYTKDSEAKVIVEHTDHDDFVYVIDIDNNARVEKTAVLRIFLAPKYDERGHPLTLKEQRVMMIELDKFKATLKPGHNVVRRCSNESSVTMPVDHIYGDITRTVDEDHCHCGWPEYLLVPQGDYDGMHYELFVMATNYDEDKAQDTDLSCKCHAHSYCGNILGEYLDKRPLGYPFDRKIKATGWAEFKTQNMCDADIVIKFSGKNKDH
uniref:Hemocyanin subunit 1 n=1 Tax=Spirostreptus sp. BT-2000 TaxID=138905 RepID=Q9BHJ9_9MYRI|nr:hemocyanin subunit 1 [Spirostreptus sp. BT-2000]